MTHSTADVPIFFTRVSPLEHGFKYYSKLPTCTYLQSAILLPFEVLLGYLRTTAIVPSKYYIGTFEIPLQYLKSTARVLSKYRTGTLQVPLSTVPLPYRTGTFVDVFCVYCTCVHTYVHVCTQQTQRPCTCIHVHVHVCKYAYDKGGNTGSYIICTCSRLDPKLFTVHTTVNSHASLWSLAYDNTRLVHRVHIVLETKVSSHSVSQHAMIGVPGRQLEGVDPVIRGG